MVQGASSGVGIIGLQIAKLIGAGFVVGTSTNDKRRAQLKEFGADLAVNTKDADWPEQVVKATGGKGVNLTVDMLSGPVVSQTMAATALLGRIVNIGRLAGMKAEFDFDTHARKRIDYIGVTFRTRSSRRSAKSSSRCAPTSGTRSPPASSRCRSTRPIRSPTPRPATSTCAPTRISGRFDRSPRLWGPSKDNFDTPGVIPRNPSGLVELLCWPSLG